MITGRQQVQMFNPSSSISKKTDMEIEINNGDKCPHKTCQDKSYGNLLVFVQSKFLHVNKS